MGTCLSTDKDYLQVRYLYSFYDKFKLYCTMKFIRLTSKFRGMTYYVNPEKIVTFNRSSSDTGTSVCFEGENNDVIVVETPEQIIKKVSDAKL